jgi:hypothetical protein
MTLAEQILQEIEQLPPEQQRAALDFVTFLKLHTSSEGKNERLENLSDHPVFGSWKNRNIDALASEQALRAEWDNPEGDKAWAHLQPKQ